MDAIFEALACPARRRLLTVLASAGPSTVTTLCQQTGLELKLASRHLTNLKLRGLVIPRRDRQHIWYTAAPGLVRYEEQGDRYALTVMSQPNGVRVTVFEPVAVTFDTASHAPAQVAEDQQGA